MDAGLQSHGKEATTTTFRYLLGGRTYSPVLSTCPNPIPEAEKEAGVEAGAEAEDDDAAAEKGAEEEENEDQAAAPSPGAALPVGAFPWSSSLSSEEAQRSTTAAADDEEAEEADEEEEEPGCCICRRCRSRARSASRALRFIRVAWAEAERRRWLLRGLRRRDLF